MEVRFSAPVQTGCEVHPASCTMYTESFPGVKRPGRSVDHPPPCSAEVKERVQLYVYSPFWNFVACYKVNFIFTFTFYVCHLLLFVHVRPANQPTVTGVALCNKKVGDPRYNKVVLMVNQAQNHEKVCVMVAEAS